MTLTSVENKKKERARNKTKPHTKSCIEDHRGKKKRQFCCISCVGLTINPVFRWLLVIFLGICKFRTVSLFVPNCTIVQNRTKRHVAEPSAVELGLWPVVDVQLPPLYRPKQMPA